MTKEKYNCPVCMKEVNMPSFADWHYHMTAHIDLERSVIVRHTWFICNECSREEGNDSKEFKCPPHEITEIPYDTDEFHDAEL